MTDDINNNDIKNLQNRLHIITAKQSISSMTLREKQDKIEELKKRGYECNEYFETLLRQDYELPYGSILFFLLVQNNE